MQNLPTRPLKAHHLKRPKISLAKLIVIGDSLYAVVEAVRLSRTFGATKFVCPSRRVGIYPYSILPESFFEEMKVNPNKHVEAVVQDVVFGETKLLLSKPLRICRTTPLLEQTLANNDVSLLPKLPTNSQDSVVDCTGKKWPNLVVSQSLETISRNHAPQLTISAELPDIISITVVFNHLLIQTFYTKQPIKKDEKSLARTIRPSAYIDRNSGLLFPVFSVFGPDYAEWYAHRKELVKQLDVISWGNFEKLYTFLQPHDE